MSTYEKQRIEMLMYNPEFKEKLLALRNKWGIPHNGFSDFNNLKRWEIGILNAKKNDDFNVEFDNVANKYPEHYKEIIYAMLTLGSVDLIPSVMGRRIKLIRKPDPYNKDKDKVFLEIFSDTSIKDVQAIWGYVNAVKKNAIDYREGRNKKSKNQEVNLLMLELRNQGKSYVEINNILIQKLGYKISYDEISRSLDKMKRKIKKI